ncbi:MAG: cytidine deaminase [Bacteroidetes bacterium]|nr:cytidine deaminase [Bacteroidota bacterium]MBU1717434.1 cytidine deaminase [Bacteroidota bacterium]
MKQNSQTLVFTEYESIAELPQEEQELFRASLEAAKDAYAPYSRFQVGAAVKMTNGEIFRANNQENAAYPSGLCAERIAAFAAKSNCKNEKIRVIAISAISDIYKIDSPVYPCGSCRQVMAEYEMVDGSPIRFILGGKVGKIHVFDGIANLLPFIFDLDQFK